MTGVRKLFVLLCGFKIVPKSAATRDRGERLILSLPISAYLLDTAEGLILVDTGVSGELLDDPELCRECFTDQGWEPLPIVRREHELLGQLKTLGVSPDEVEGVILTHLHAGHAGGLRHFRHARVSVQMVEYEHAIGDEASKAYFQGDFNFLDMRWDLLEGDCEIMPGLEVLSTPGHTPGHQSVLITLPQAGEIVLVGDVGDLQENFDGEILPSKAVDDEAALSSIRRLKRLAEEGTELFIGHDPALVQRLKLAPGGYR